MTAARRIVHVQSTGLLEAVCRHEPTRDRHVVVANQGSRLCVGQRGVCGNGQVQVERFIWLDDHITLHQDDD